MNNQKTIVLVLRSGGDFSLQDVLLLTQKIKDKWEAETRPRIICLYDKVSQVYDLGELQLIPLNTELPGTWSRMILYSPKMEQYKPFLYIDLDTVIVNTIERLFELITDEKKVVTLEDFWQKGKLATGLMWFPAQSKKIDTVWKSWKGKMTGNRMDYFLRKYLKPDLYWQQLTNTIYDFKPSKGNELKSIPEGANVICFHGKPRIFNCGIQWVKDYVSEKPKVTVIISYREDRGWLQEAIDSVPKWVQVILKQGTTGFSVDFNRGLKEATGDYIKYLHEDDMITPEGIENAVKTIQIQNVDFIHGDVYELSESTGKKVYWTPRIKTPLLSDLLKKNTIHSASMMYRKEVFEKVGGFKEGLDSSEDYEFNLRCLKAGLKIGYCNKPLAIYRRHAAQKVRITPTTIQRSTRETIKNEYK